MSATILKFPELAGRHSVRHTAPTAQPLGPGVRPPPQTTPDAGAVFTAAQRRYSETLERRINHAHSELLAAKTEEAQRSWWECMVALCWLREKR